MKKIFISLILTFALLILSNVESRGQCASCPSGYVPQQVNLDIGGGCIVTIHYCMLCHPTGTPEAKLCGVYIPVSCGVITMDYEFWWNIRKKLITDLAIKCSYSGEIEPCPQQNVFSIDEGFCYGIYPNHPTNPTGYDIKPCVGEAGECYKTYEICWEGSDLKLKVINQTIIPAGCDVMEFEFDPNDPPYYCFTFCP
jgi:hypothetical protein